MDSYLREFRDKCFSGYIRLHFKPEIYGHDEYLVFTVVDAGLHWIGLGPFCDELTFEPLGFMTFDDFSKWARGAGKFSKLSHQPNKRLSWSEIVSKVARHKLVNIASTDHEYRKDDREICLASGARVSVDSLGLNPRDNTVVECEKMLIGAYGKLTGKSPIAIQEELSGNNPTYQDYVIG